MNSISFNYYSVIGAANDWQVHSVYYSEKRKRLEGERWKARTGRMVFGQNEILNFNRG